MELGGKKVNGGVKIETSACVLEDIRVEHDVFVWRKDGRVGEALSEWKGGLSVTRRGRVVRVRVRERVRGKGARSGVSGRGVKGLVRAIDESTDIWKEGYGRDFTITAVAKGGRRGDGGGWR